MDWLGFWPWAVAGGEALLVTLPAPLPLLDLPWDESSWPVGVQELSRLALRVKLTGVAFRSCSRTGHWRYPGETQKCE